MRKLFALMLALPLLAAAGREYDYRYWFDSQIDGPLSASGRSSSPTLELSPDVSSLREGIHTFNFSVADPAGGVISIRSNYFLRLATSIGQTYRVQTLVDGQPYRADEVVSTGPSLHYDLDATSLPYGLHSLSVALITESGAVSAFHEAMFFRVATSAETSAMTLHYMVDGKEAGTAPLSGGSALLQLDLSELSAGVHELTVYASDGRELTTSCASRIFIRTPGPIEAYTYWFNNDVASAKTVKNAELQAELHLIDMLAVEALPFRSKMFACEPDAATGNLTLYSRNELSVAFFTKGGHTMAMDSRCYTDQRVSRTVDTSEIQPLENGYNVSETLSTPAENGIIWRSFDAEPGQLVEVKASVACDINIWDSTGEQVFSTSGAAATKSQSFVVAVKGKYFVAIHDVVSSARATDITFTYSIIPTYAIISHYPQQSANDGVLMCGVFGNNFNKLSTVRLVNGDIEICSTAISASDNYNAEVCFELNSAPIGDYILRAEYIDSETGQSKFVDAGAIKLESAVPGEVVVSFEPSERIGVPQLDKITITNTGNKSLLFTPISIACEKPTEKCYIQFGNFDIDSIEGDVQSVVYTDNLMDRNTSGALFSGLIPYIMPYETLTLDIPLYSDSIKEFSINYAIWAGEPWSEELRRITTDEFRVSNEDFYQTNQLTLTNLLLMETAQLIEDGVIIVPESDGIVGKMDGKEYFLSDEEFSLLYNMTLGNNPFLPGSIAAQSVSNLSELIGLQCENPERLFRYDRQNNSSLRKRTARKRTAKVVTGINLGYRGSTGAYEAIKPSVTSVTSFHNMLNETTLSKYKFTFPGGLFSTSGNSGNAFTEFGTGRRVLAFGKSAASNVIPLRPGKTKFVRKSYDPNDIIGPIDNVGGSFIGIGRTKLPYTIEFENDSELASASALTIDVTNQLDGSVFDLSTFRATELNIGGKIIELPAEHKFIRTLDLRPQINSVAQLEMTYDVSTGKSHWHLTSLDPMTMERTDYLEQGILPVNDSISHRGEGMVSYTIGLKPGLADGTKVRNQASIVFDTNAPIETPVWENTLDYSLPTAQVEVSTADNSHYDFTFTGSDSGAGIWRYTLYMRAPGSDEWRLLRDGIEQTEFGYDAPEALPAGTMFAVIATDGAGNRQDSDFMRLQPGDVDRSGVVDANDVLALSAYYMGKQVNIALVVSDVNSDGLIDSQDVLAIARIYLQMYPSKKQQRTRKYSTQKK